MFLRSRARAWGAHVDERAFHPARTGVACAAGAAVVVQGELPRFLGPGSTLPVTDLVSARFNTRLVLISAEARLRGSPRPLADAN